MTTITAITGVTKKIVKNFAKQARRQGFTEKGIGISKQLESGVELRAYTTQGKLKINAFKENQYGAGLSDFFEAGLKSGRPKHVRSTVTTPGTGDVYIWPGKKGFLGIGRQNGYAIASLRVMGDDILRGNVSGASREYRAVLNPSMTKVKEVILNIFQKGGKGLQERKVVPAEEFEKTAKAIIESDSSAVPFH